MIIDTSDVEIIGNSKRCRGRNFDRERCCTAATPCVEEEGDCDADVDCAGNLICGNNNCKPFGSFYHKKDDCCVKPSTLDTVEATDGPRCRGRNFAPPLCCTQDNPCQEGEGDCEEDVDCMGTLVCGNNNCKAFGSFFHEKDDCCIKPIVNKVIPERVFPLLEPFPGELSSFQHFQSFWGFRTKMCRA